MTIFKSIAAWIDVALARIDPLPPKMMYETTAGEVGAWYEDRFYEDEAIVELPTNLTFSNNIVLDGIRTADEKKYGIQMPSEWPVSAKYTPEGLVTEFKRDGVVYAYMTRTPLPNATSYDIFKANGLFVDRVEGDWPIHRIIQSITGK